MGGASTFAARLITTFFALAIFAAPFAASAADTVNWDAGNNPTPLLDSAHFRWWNSETTKKIRGVLVFLPGRNGDSRGMISDPEWRELAKKESFALIGCSLFKQSTNSYQSDPDGKVSALIQKAVATLAAANGHDYLKTPPIAFWGTSAGSNLAERFASRYPKQVVAIASIKGTWGSREFSPEKGEIPWLFCVGKQDKPEWVQASLKSIRDGMEKKAFWTLALHPTEGHSTGKTKPLAISFLTSAIELRMGSASSATTGNRLQKLSIKGSWIGDGESMEIQAHNGFPGSKESTWLPDERTAKAWLAYLKPLPAPATKNATPEHLEQPSAPTPSTGSTQENKSKEAPPNTTQAVEMESDQEAPSPPPQGSPEDNPPAPPEGAPPANRGEPEAN